jgi:hypothetical protein
MGIGIVLLLAASPSRASPLDRPAGEGARPGTVALEREIAGALGDTADAGDFLPVFGLSPGREGGGDL